MSTAVRRKPGLGLVALLLLIGGVAVAAEMPTAPPPLGKLIDVGGYRVHIYCTGSGGPTVIVAGGGFSVDWGLIQPEVAKSTRICTYDPSGTAWSDAYRPLTEQGGSSLHCADRVIELHRLLKNADIRGPFVFVGFSIGGLIGRLYTHEYPDEVAGMVIVDHAFTDTRSDERARSEVSSHSTEPGNTAQPASTGSVDTPPVLISSTPITLGIEDDENFARLPQRNRDMHNWAMANHPLRPTPELADECSAELERATAGQSEALGNRPLIVIRTTYESPSYERLQAKLRSLSSNSKLILARNSSHMVIVDDPELVSSSILQIVRAVNSMTRQR